jgi:hypothetical protein
MACSSPKPTALIPAARGLTAIATIALAVLAAVAAT